MKLYELKIEDEAVDGIFAISMVDDPAIMAWGTYFNKEEVRFAEVEKEQNLFMAPILIPDRKILRVDGEGIPYEVFLSKDTIKRLSQLYLEKKLQDQITIEHDKKVEGITLVESWIKESANKDKSLLYNLSAPVGSWIGTFRIVNEEMREKFRKGEVSAVSIEGLFAHELVQASKVQDKDIEDMTEEEADEFLKLLRNLIFGEQPSITSSYPGEKAVDLEVGVPHYTKDGTLYEGPTHKDADGNLMTGATHTEDSEYLYHGEELITPNPCQEGYVAIGTKTKDGREVPNCVPKD